MSGCLRVFGIIRPVEADNIVSFEDVPAGVRFIAEHICNAASNHTSSSSTGFLEEAELLLAEAS
ncbi:hypothetical protein E4U59_006328 [Claviceps monticola]|nr:hypothetical protein E4U59_006328 [Claviceps monticola]